MKTVEEILKSDYATLQELNEYALDDESQALLDDEIKSRLVTRHTPNKILFTQDLEHTTRLHRYTLQEAYAQICFPDAVWCTVSNKHVLAQKHMFGSQFIYYLVVWKQE